jgi:protein-arginine kinase activator protein McsA
MWYILPCRPSSGRVPALRKARNVLQRRITGATEELQQQLDRAVEAKDYEAAASLKRMMESDCPVTEEV